MSPYELYLKRGDTITKSLTASDDLDIATEVRVVVANDEGELINKVVGLENIDGKIVLVPFTAVETVNVGEWDLEIHATFVDGQAITYPERGYIKVYITEDLD